jgi:O-antigen biosynthesis alpha-1,2-mannosyltransferase
MMRIVIDLQGAQTESRFRGIGRYTLSLVEAILRNNNNTHEILLILNSGFSESILQIKNIFKNLLPKSNFLIFDVPKLISLENTNNTWKRNAAELIRESFIEDLEPDAVIITSIFEGSKQDNAVGSIKRLESPAIQSVILYDLIPLLNQRIYLTSDFERYWYFNKLEHLKSSDLIFSISEYTTAEAKNFLNISDHKIINIGSSHAKKFCPIELDLSEKTDMMNRLGITKPFVMSNGPCEARKNHEGLLRAFAMLPSHFRDSMQLVITGKFKQSDIQSLGNIAKDLGIQQSLMVTGYVSDEDLMALFSLCEVFVFPSTEEGFGLPALEAMACGAPTIGSNRTGIPEAIGYEDALFDPLNPEDIASKILRVLTDADFNTLLRSHALTWSSKFSWDKCAERLIKSFENVISNRKSVSNNEWSNFIAESQRRYSDLIDAIIKTDTKITKPSDSELQEVACCISNNKTLALQFKRPHILPKHINWRIEGPFDSSYSLALVNRECARALKLLGHNIILSSEGPDEFHPNPRFMKANFDLNEMYKRSLEPEYSSSEVTSRNNYPPRVSDMNGQLNFLHAYGWEETGFPVEWVEEFNAYLQGITVMSKHVQKILIDAGIRIPIAVSGIGVDHWLQIKSDPDFKLTNKKFHFLHVSSCFPRKGVDVLLRAYGMSFKKNDDVCLVIKTFSNPHNEIEKWLAEARVSNNEFPDVLIIEEDFTDSQLKALYEKCNVLVSPSRAEGFCLPLAEAMLSDIPVITIGWSGQLDFCNKENSWLVDYKFVAAKSHFDLFDSVWAEPDVNHLATTMNIVYEASETLRRKKAGAGKKYILDRFRWTHVAERLVDFARSSAQSTSSLKPNIGWVTTWNSRCGIATYSEHLIKNISSEVNIFAPKTFDKTQEDGPEVNRCWEISESESFFGLEACIEKCQIDVLVIQFNYGFFNLINFGDFLRKQVDIGRIIVLTLHSTVEPINAMPHKRLGFIHEQLANCHRILVHSINDLNRLKELGLVDNVTLFPHGVFNHNHHANSFFGEMKKKNFMIASYGFFLPHKGLLELIEAIALLNKWGNKINLCMINSEYPDVKSAAIIKKARKKISSLGLVNQVQLTTEFLPDYKIFENLSNADLIVFPYQNTGESASGAVRYGISVGKPVAVTPCDIFDDVLSAVFMLPGKTPELIAKGIEKILFEISTHSDIAREKSLALERWRQEHDYEKLGLRLNNIAEALYRMQSD